MIELSGKVKVASYINNLGSEKYPQFIPMIEQSFQHFLKQVLLKSLKGQPLQVIVKVVSIDLDTTKPNYPGGSWHIFIYCITII